MTQSTYASTNLVWLDLEMTGLDPQYDRIIEIAVVITDQHLNPLAEGPVIAVNQPDSLVDHMNEWCMKTHSNSGLIDRVKHSCVTEAQAEKQILNFIQQYVPYQFSPLCGNSICQDRRFLAKYMPTLNDYFHYRLLDVSTLKILAERWFPEVTQSLVKRNQHLALADIYDSIYELKHYRQHLFKAD